MTAQAILIVWIVFFLLEFFFSWILDILNLNRTIKNRSTVPAAFDTLVDDETYKRSTQYTLRKGRFGLFSSFQGHLFLVLILAFNAAGAFDMLLSSWELPEYWRGFLFLAGASAVMELAGLPASLYFRFIIEEEFGFNTSGFKIFLTDMIKSALLGTLLLMLLLAGLYAVRIVAASWWWLAAWAFVAFFQLMIMLLYPLLIAPLFNKFEPLPDGELKNRLNALALRCDFKVKEIFVMDGSRRSRHSNAYFTGIGRSRRIVIFDTLIDSLSPGELEAVLAHEIGHWKHGHLKKMILLSLVSTLGFFAIAGLAIKWGTLFEAFGFSEISFHALLFLLLFFSEPLKFFFTPLFNLGSRKHEYQADAYACLQCSGPESLIHALLNLSRDNLSNLTPHPLYSFWHYSHPSLSERITALNHI